MPAGQDSTTLELSSALVLRACKVAAGSPEYAVEAGYQALLQGDMEGALAQYSRASHLHELDMDAMYGSIERDLLIGKVGRLKLLGLHQLLCITSLRFACKQIFETELFLHQFGRGSLLMYEKSSAFDLNMFPRR